MVHAPPPPKVPPVFVAPLLVCLLSADAGGPAWPGDRPLARPDGTAATLDDIAGGAPAVAVVFVGTECPLVRATLPRLLREAADPRVRMILVDANRQDSADDLAAFAVEFDLADAGAPLLRDAGNRLADDLAATRTPEAFLFGPARRDGNGGGTRELKYRGLVDRRSGVGVVRPAETRDDFGDALAAVLAGEPVAVPVTEVEGCKIGRVKEVKPDAAVTWANGAAAVVYENCLPCHRAGEAAPMPLADAREAAGWGEMIAEVVTQNRMPPWHADPAHGTFANDARLTDEEKATLLAWCAAGCPLGDLSTAPEPPAFAEGWRIGEPDAVFAMADEPVAVPASGTLGYEYLRVDPQFAEDRYVVAAEPRPGDRRAVHHIIVRVLDPPTPGERRRPRIDPGDALIGYAPGLPPMELAPGQAFKIAAGSQLLFEVHYTATGTATEDLSRVGLKFADPADVAAHESGEHPFTLVKSVAVMNPRFEIPPGAAAHEVVAERVLPRDLTVLALTPHMHYRGAAFRYDLTTPGGETTTLLDVPRYDFNWQHRYDLAEPLRVEKGSRITATAVYDNSAGNPANPDPAAAVRWGEQSWEEMMIGFLLVAVE